MLHNLTFSSLQIHQLCSTTSDEEARRADRTSRKPPNAFSTPRGRQSRSQPSMQLLPGAAPAHNDPHLRKHSPCDRAHNVHSRGTRYHHNDEHSHRVDDNNEHEPPIYHDDRFGGRRQCQLREEVRFAEMHL